MTIWALLGEKIGDNNQLLALAEGLMLPFETRPMRYNLGRAVPPRFLGATLATLTGEARRTIAPPWPDVVLAIGRRSVPVARYIRRASGGRTRLVLVGHPRVDPRAFDLVITTHQYPVPKRGNVIVLPMAMSRLRAPGPASAAEAATLGALPRPHLLLALGGPTKYWDLSAEAIEAAARTLVRRAEAAGGTLIAVGSRRTPEAVLNAVSAAIAGGRHRLVDGLSPGFALLMADADQLFVTADSVSMLSEAIQTGKRVGMVPIILSAKGKRLLGEGETPRRGRRDLRRIWTTLRERGLVGTVECPSSGEAMLSSLDQAVAAVRNLIEEGR